VNKGINALHCGSEIRCRLIRGEIREIRGRKFRRLFGSNSPLHFPIGCLIERFPAKVERVGRQVTEAIRDEVKQAHVRSVAVLGHLSARRRSDRLEEPRPKPGHGPHPDAAHLGSLRQSAAGSQRIPHRGDLRDGQGKRRLGEAQVVQRVAANPPRSVKADGVFRRLPNEGE
jgi:hypothetical protein